VRNGDNGGLSEISPNDFPDFLIRIGVETAASFVQDNNLSTSQEYSCETD
jgi:hypothetical protein